MTEFDVDQAIERYHAIMRLTHAARSVPSLAISRLYQAIETLSEEERSFFISSIADSPTALDDQPVPTR